MIDMHGRPFRGHRGELQEVLEVHGHLVDALGLVEAHAGHVVRVGHLRLELGRPGEGGGRVGVLAARVVHDPELIVGLRELGAVLDALPRGFERAVEVAVDQRARRLADGAPGLAAAREAAEVLLRLAVLIDLPAGESLAILRVRRRVGRRLLDDLLVFAGVEELLESSWAGAGWANPGVARAMAHVTASSIPVSRIVMSSLLCERTAEVPARAHALSSTLYPCAS